MTQMEKREYAAYTIRPKIRKLLPRYLSPCRPFECAKSSICRFRSFHTMVTSANIAALRRVLGNRSQRAAIAGISWWLGGSRTAAEDISCARISAAIPAFTMSHPRRPHLRLSPYLHFGHLSSLDVALAVQEYAQNA